MIRVGRVLGNPAEIKIDWGLKGAIVKENQY